MSQSFIPISSNMTRVTTYYISKSILKIKNSKYLKFITHTRYVEVKDSN
ncbi:MAG: hypothetical protein OXC46_01050 [Thaumarchaeota archaeon]|nr:hypothetical protein [Nitrososphaerota archaeon]